MKLTNAKSLSPALERIAVAEVFVMALGSKTKPDANELRKVISTDTTYDIKPI